MVSISPEIFDRLVNFKGYGTPAGKYWFIGMEEGLERGGDLQHELEVRATWNEVEDVHVTRSSLGLTMVGRHPTWYAMARMALKLDENEGWASSAFSKPYKEQRLGRLDGDTFLIEILPLPATRAHEWPYSAPFDTREEYEVAIRPARLNMIRNLMSQYSPRIVFCHGATNWESCRTMFPGEYVELLSGDIQVARVGSTVVVLTWNLSAWGMEIPKLGQIVDAVIGFEERTA